MHALCACTIRPPHLRQRTNALYFNFSSRIAEDYWSRRSFLQSWWRVNARDRRWTPPLYSFLYKSLVRRNEPFLHDFAPLPLTLEAVERQTQRPAMSGLTGLAAPGGMGDSIVAHTLLLHDRRQIPATAYLGMLAFANDEETLDMLLQRAWEQGQRAGVRRLVAPAALAPALSAGLLLDNFHLAPPLHTPYNAPYLPELLEGALDPLFRSRLWHMDVTPAAAVAAALPALEIATFDAQRLATDLLPLARDATPAGHALPPPTPMR